MGALSATHTAALVWLNERGGEGVIDRYGALTAGGSRKSSGSAQVWLRLFTTGHVMSGGPNRIRITAAGRAALPTKGHPASPSKFTGPRERAPMLDEEEA